MNRHIRAKLPEYKNILLQEISYERIVIRPLRRNSPVQTTKIYEAYLQSLRLSISVFLTRKEIIHLGKKRWVRVTSHIIGVYILQPRNYLLRNNRISITNGLMYIESNVPFHMFLTRFGTTFFLNRNMKIAHLVPSTAPFVLTGTDFGVLFQMSDYQNLHEYWPDECRVKFLGRIGFLNSFYLIFLCRYFGLFINHTSVSDYLDFLLKCLAHPVVRAPLHFPVSLTVDKFKESLIPSAFHLDIYPSTASSKLGSGTILVRR